MTAEQWVACAVIGGVVIADMVSFWAVMANHNRRLNQIERLVMLQEGTRRRFESEMRVDERRRSRP